MSITSIASQGAVNNAQSGIQMERAAARASSGSEVEVQFSPPSKSAAPMSQLSNGLLDSLRNFEQTRAQNRDAMQSTGTGPASSIAAAKSEMLGGPANIRPASGDALNVKPVESPGFDEAVQAMTRSFDYAIETQLIVKTGSQFSSSAASLMRGQ